MKVFITGANGFVGQHLCRLLVEEGHSVTALVRSERAWHSLPDGVACVIGDPTRPGPWQESIAGHDAVVNLAGASVFKRWTADYKKLLRDSRILTTRHVVEAIPAGAPLTLLSTSAVGYYGFTGDEELDESAPAGRDFLARLAVDWENEALEARRKAIRVVLPRFGVVLGSSGGALDQMTLPFRFFFGGPIGDGRQWLSWIHMDDLCRAYSFLFDHPEIEGPVNFTAPVPVRNRELATAIGKAMGRPSFMPAPGFMISLVLGEFGSVILKGQRVVPRVLETGGFSFRFPTIDTALGDLLTG
jgi:uncharacterized protein (TIGR01777 family)